VRTARSNDGFALVTALVLLTVMMGLGLALLFLTDNQQKASSREQAGETAFNVAEATLNAQIGQLSHSWPGEKEGIEYPPVCTTATTAATNGCPSAEGLSAAYPNAGSSSCPAGTPKDSWGSSLSNGWTTYVRDDLGESTYFNSTAESAAGTPRYDANGDKKVWVRSVGVVQCRIVVLVALASAQFVARTFPQSALAGNWFETSNNGNKTIVDTLGGAGAPGGVIMRCAGRTASNCEVYQATPKEQVNPDTTKTEATPSSAMTASELETEKSAAISAVPKTYFPPNACPNNLAELSGKPTYIEGPCTLRFNGGTANSVEKPGFLILVNGTIALEGNAKFYGTIYAVNRQESSGVVVEVHGDAQLKGTIVVDGNGGISVGSSGSQKEANVIYDPTAAKELTTFAGASATRNSFRVLPVNQ
jgi:Tfp pilus assembly protein PilX